MNKTYNPTFPSTFLFLKKSFILFLFFCEINFKLRTFFHELFQIFILQVSPDFWNYFEQEMSSLCFNHYLGTTYTLIQITSNNATQGILITLGVIFFCKFCENSHTLKFFFLILEFFMAIFEFSKKSPFYGKIHLFLSSLWALFVTRPQQSPTINIVAKKQQIIRRK